MKRAINFVALLLTVASVSGCATTTATNPPSHRERLKVVTDVAVYQQQVRQDPDKQLVELQSLGIAADVRYATDRNFMKRALYPSAKVYLRAPAARALLEVQRELAQRGIAIKVWDAYRPYTVTEEMWEQIKNPDYVADPASGSRHNRGAAVDLTMTYMRAGDVLSMPTFYDDFTPRAHHDFMKLPAKVIENRTLLRDTMVKHGFEPLPSEWWHYDFKGWERFELLDLPFSAL
jgi:D-alanyl-D-alanine dipeptidase